MRDPERIDKVLKALGELWKLHPDLRLGQLMFNLVDRGGYKSLYYLEDDALLREIQIAEGGWDPPISSPRHDMGGSYPTT